MTGYPLEPDSSAMAAMGKGVLERAIKFVEGLPDRPATAAATDPELVRRMLAPPPEAPGELAALLDRVDEAAAHAVETAGPGYFGYIPGGGLYTAAIADFYARVTNRYVGMAGLAPALTALEHSVVRWLARAVCGLPEGSGGVLTSGGSLANFSAVVAARHAHLGEEIGDGTLYVTAHTHQSIAKAARLAGIRAAHVRLVPHDDRLRMDPAAAATMIAADRAAGRRPFLLVGSAGTTNTGAVDPLPQLADLARREGLWLHADGAYGGFFRLTERGRDRLAGIERADSVTLDPHKSLFLPYGTGALVVRDPAALAAAHTVGGEYLQDLAADDTLPDYANLGAELSRDLRGLRVWLPLHLHGVAAFRAALDEKLDLTERAYQRLGAEPRLVLPWRPELTTVAFRHRDGEPAGRRLLDRVNAGGRAFLSSTLIDGRYTLRLCVVSHRSHADRVTEAVDAIRAAC
jgi:aromatic-L-amino-acid decarboxylase